MSVTGAAALAGVVGTGTVLIRLFVLKRRGVRIGELAISLGGGVILTLLSALVSTERTAGMGVYASWGWPKPMFGRWSGFEGEERTDWLMLYIAVDLALWTIVGFALLTAWLVFTPRPPVQAGTGQGL